MKLSKDLILIYGPPWNQPARLSKHHFSKEWSNKSKVLYVEAPINFSSFITRREEAIELFKRFLSGPEKIKQNLWISSFFYIFPFRGSKYLFGSKIINMINQYFVKNKLIRQIKKLGIKNPIVIISNANILPIIDSIQSSKIIYHCSDDYTIISSFPESFLEIEEKLIKKCDLIVTTADELMNAKKHLNKNIVSIPNGANIEHFFKTQDQNLKIPQDISKYDNPIIGYVGSVFEWLDIDWIRYAAEKCPDFDFVFIGPISIDISELKKYSNVHFLGPRSYEDLPKYMKAFKVAVIPFVIDGVTLKASPIKFYEYLASGLPIVSTELPDLMKFADVSHLAKGKEEYVNFIKLALENENEKSMKNRMELSKNYSWKSRFKTLIKEINKIS